MFAEAFLTDNARQMVPKSNNAWQHVRLAQINGIDPCLHETLWPMNALLITYDLQWTVKNPTKSFSMLKSSRVSNASLFALLALPKRLKGHDTVEEKKQGKDTESAGCDRGASSLHYMAPQPRLSPCNKFDSLFRVGGLGVGSFDTTCLTTVIAIPLSILLFKMIGCTKSDQWDLPIS